MSNATTYNPAGFEDYNGWHNNDCGGSGPCDKGGCRRLPASADPGGSADILCHSCYLRNMAWRRKRNQYLERHNQFPQPAWTDPAVYPEEEE